MGRPEKRRKDRERAAKKCKRIDSFLAPCPKKRKVVDHDNAESMTSSTTSHTGQGELSNNPY